MTSLLFSLYILLLPWQSVFLLREAFIAGEKWHYGTIGLYPATLLAIILIIFLLLARVLHKIPPTKNDRPILLTGALFIVFSFLSALWAHDPVITLYSTGLFACGFLLYVLIPSHIITFRTAALLLLVSASLHSVIALTQFLMQTIDPQALLSISQRLSESGTTATITDITGRWLRAYGGMPHPNILGGFLALALLTGTHAYIQTHKSHSFMRGIFLVGLALSFAGLIVTFSRSAWIALIIGFLTTAIILWHKRQSLFRRIQMPLLSFLSIALIFLIFMPHLFVARTLHDTQGNHNSLSDRTHYVSQAKELLQNNPYIGVGRGNMTIVGYEQSADPLKQIWHYQPVHNVFVLILTELGIIGFCLFMTLILLVPLTILRTSKGHPVSHAFFAGICLSLLAIAFLDHWLITSHFGILLFWTLMTLYKNTRG